QLSLLGQSEGFTILGSAGIDNITGSNGDDIIVGAQNDFLLDGAQGIDTLQIGANFTSAGDGKIANIENIVLTAAAVLDLSNQNEGFTITGSAGADSITGGHGTDIINGDQSDTLFDGNG